MITTAFANVQLGRGRTLYQARALDDYATEKEVLRAASKDNETHWTQVRSDKVEALHDVLPFLDRKGLQFYIAAFMMHSLVHPNGPCQVASRTQFALRGYKTYDTTELQAYAFTHAQYRAVAAFLRYMVATTGGNPDEDFHLVEIEAWVASLTGDEAEIVAEPPAPPPAGQRGRGKRGRGRGQPGRPSGNNTRKK